MRKAYRATKTVRDRYTKSDCYIIAIDLHRLTGWDIVVVHNGDSNKSMLEGEWCSCHVFCVSPCGDYALDVNGITTLGEMGAHWQDILGKFITFWTAPSLDVYMEHLKTWPPFTREEKELARRTAKRVVSRVFS